MAELKPALDRLYESFNYPGLGHRSDSDRPPLAERPDDREIVGLCAAALAFGRVSSVLQSIERLLAVMGGQPAAYVRQFDPGATAPRSPTSSIDGRAGRISWRSSGS